MSHVNFLRHEEILNLRRELQKTKRIRHRRTALAENLRHLILSHIKLTHQTAHTVGFFDGIKTFALDILNQREGERFFIRHLADDHRHLGQAGKLCRPEASLAGNDLPLPFPHRTHNERGHQSLGLDRGRQRSNRLRIHMRSRLILTWPELLNTQFRQAGTRLFAMILLGRLRLKNFLRAFQSESPQSAPQSFFLYRHDTPSFFTGLLEFGQNFCSKSFVSLGPLG